MIKCRKRREILQLKQTELEQICIYVNANKVFLFKEKVNNRQTQCSVSCSRLVFKALGSFITRSKVITISPFPNGEILKFFSALICYLFFYIKN